jgi:hypothetical protein
VVGEVLASFVWAYIVGEVRPKVDNTCRVVVGHGAPYCLDAKDVVRRWSKALSKEVVRTVRESQRLRGAHYLSSEDWGDARTAK